MVFAAADTVVLAENGKSDFKLVVPAEFQKPLAEDIGEFVRCLEAAAGCRLAVVGKASGKVIVLQINPVFKIC